MTLPARFGIAEAAETHSVLLAALAELPSLSIDASQVTDIDTAGLQLLACAWRECTTRGGRCAWHGIVPQSVRRAARLIGLHEFLIE